MLSENNVLCSQQAHTTGCLDAIFGFFREIFGLYNDWLFWDVSTTQQFVETLKWEENKKKNTENYLDLAE